MEQQQQPTEAERKIKGSWTPEEDALLTQLVGLHGPRNWTLISEGIPGRSGKSCRLRWCNQLSPLVHHRPFTEAEDATILAAHAEFGNKWATIARLLPGRTDNGIKNHWNSTLRRRRMRGERSGDIEEEKKDVKRVKKEEEVAVETVLKLSPPGVVMEREMMGMGLVGLMREMIAEEVRRYVAAREEVGKRDA